jgi:excinuclease ABC subunit C
VLVTRGRELGKQFEHVKVKYLFGPFPHGGVFKDALRIIRKIFPFYDTKAPVTSSKSKVQLGKILFNQQIGIYPKNITREEYARLIHHLKLFFEGRKKDLIKSLEQEMKSYASRKEFEKAETVKRRIFALKHIQDVALIKKELKEPMQNEGQRKIFRIEAYDVAHTGGTDMVGAMVVSENGTLKPDLYRKFKIRSVTKSDDTASLKELLERRLTHAEWQYPSLIVVDGGMAQQNVAEKVLEENGYAIPTVAVVKGVGHKPRRILGNRVIVHRHESIILKANAEAHRFSLSYHRSLREKL